MDVILHDASKLLIKLIIGVCWYLAIRGTIWGLKHLMTRTERMYAIFMHYQYRALGYGHPSTSVLYCSEKPCTVFA